MLAEVFVAGLLGMTLFLLMDQWYMATSPVIVIAGEKSRRTRNETQVEDEDDADEGKQETPVTQTQAKDSDTTITSSSYRRRESKDKNAPVKRSSVPELVAAAGPSGASTLLLTKEEQDDTEAGDKTRAPIKKGKASVSIREEF